MMKRIKGKIASIMILGSCCMMSATDSVSASIGDNASKLANTSQSEALGLAEAVGLIGVVACGILMFIGKRDIAKTVGIGVLAGYFILKYAQPIWNVVSGGI